MVISVYWDKGDMHLLGEKMCSSDFLGNLQPHCHHGTMELTSTSPRCNLQLFQLLAASATKSGFVSNPNRVSDIQHTWETGR